GAPRVWGPCSAAPPANRLASDADPAAAIAEASVRRFDASAWRAPIETALSDSAAALSVVTEKLHPLVFPLARAGQSCAPCAWLYVGGRGVPVPRCRQSAP